jgi:hypothetical protein
MQFSQWLLDGLGNQGRWNATAIKREINQMSSMIKEYHEYFGSIWFSGYVGMG